MTKRFDFTQPGQAREWDDTTDSYKNHQQTSEEPYQPSKEVEKLQNEARKGVATLVAEGQGPLFPVCDKYHREAKPVVENYLYNASNLKEKLGTIFLQMHSNFAPKDFNRVIELDPHHATVHKNREIVYQSLIKKD